MATNQGKKSGNTKNDSGLGQEVSDRAHEAADRLRQGAEDLGHRAQEGYEAAQDQIRQARKEASGFVGQHPASTLLVGFGLGFGLGLLLTTLLTQEEERSWWDRHTPDALRNLDEKVSSLAHQVARQMPDSLSLRR